MWNIVWSVAQTFIRACLLPSGSTATRSGWMRPRATVMGVGTALRGRSSPAPSSPPRAATALPDTSARTAARACMSACPACTARRRTSSSRPETAAPATTALWERWRQHLVTAWQVSWWLAVHTFIRPAARLSPCTFVSVRPSARPSVRPSIHRPACLRPSIRPSLRPLPIWLPFPSPTSLPQPARRPLPASRPPAGPSPSPSPLVTLQVTSVPSATSVWRAASSASAVSPPPSSTSPGAGRPPTASSVQPVSSVLDTATWIRPARVPAATTAQPARTQPLPPPTSAR